MARPSSLLRILGLTFGLAVVVGNTIGGGILRTPGDVAGWLADPRLFVGIWGIGALYALLGANALAELGTMLPRGGGQYPFARYAFGDFAGFLVGWMDWISTCASAALIALVLGESAASLLSLTPGAANGLGIAVVAIFTLLLVRGTRPGDLAQRITSASKAVMFLVLVGACLLFAGPERAPATAARATAPTLAGFMLAAQAVIYTYDGWSAPIYFSAELDDPGRQIPRSMFYGLASVAAIYLLTNIAFVVAVPTSTLAGSPLAAATAATALFGDRGDLLVRVVVVVSLPSAVNACLLMASRTMYCMGQDRLGTAAASRLNARGAPGVALVASAATAAAFLATGTFDTIIAIAAFFFVASYSLCFIAVFVLRGREPGARRPYRAVGHPWTTGIVLLGSVAFLVSAVIADRRNSLYALVIAVASYPAYRVSRRGALPASSTDPYLTEEGRGV